MKRRRFVALGGAALIAPSFHLAQQANRVYRIALLDGKAIDPDLLEEVARGLLLETRPDEVAVPREKR